MLLLIGVPTGWRLDPEKGATRQHNFARRCVLLEKTAANVSGLHLNACYKNPDERGEKIPS